MAGQGTDSEGRAVDAAQTRRGYPQGLLDPATVGQPTVRRAIPSRYPTALREIIAGRPPASSAKLDLEVAEWCAQAPPAHATPIKNSPPESEGQPTEPRTGTFALVADELREVTGAITEGVGHFIKLPFYIAQGMKSRNARGPAPQDVAAIPESDLLDLDIAARTLVNPMAGSVIGGASALQNDQSQTPFLPQSLATPQPIDPAAEATDDSPEPFIPDAYRQTGLGPGLNRAELDAVNNHPVVYAAPLAEIAPPAVEFLPAVRPKAGPSRSRAICVASMTGVFKACRFVGQSVKFSAVDAPRFVVGVVREAAEASKPPKLAIDTAEPIAQPPAELAEAVAPVDTVVAIVAPEEVAEVAVAEVVPLTPPEDPPPQAESAAESGAAAEVAQGLEPEAPAPAVESPDIEAMVQAAVEAYAENLNQAAAETAPPIPQPTVDDAAARDTRGVPEADPEAEDEACDQESATTLEVGEEAGASPPVELAEAGVPAPPAPLRPVVPSVSNDWPVAPAIASQLEDHEEEGTTWAEGIFYAGLGTLLMTILGSSLMFALGFAINLLTQGFVSLLGVLLMVGGIGGVMIAVMLLNEWLSALRFQLSAGLRLLMRCTGVVAAAALLIAFVATTIPREHWPI